MMKVYSASGDVLFAAEGDVIVVGQGEISPTVWSGVADEGRPEISRTVLAREPLTEDDMRRRERCLDLALAATAGTDADVVGTAKQFLQFVEGYPLAETANG